MFTKEKSAQVARTKRRLPVKRQSSFDLEKAFIDPNAAKKVVIRPAPSDLKGGSTSSKHKRKDTNNNLAFFG